MVPMAVCVSVVLQQTIRKARLFTGPGENHVFSSRSHSHSCWLLQTLEARLLMVGG